MSKRSGVYNVQRIAGTEMAAGLISIDEIGQCRSGPDNGIDLEAVFGGRISGRLPEGLKVNPLYNDSNHSNNQPQEAGQDINGNMSNVHVVTYETFPQKKAKMKPTLSDPVQKVENGFMFSSKDLASAVDHSDVDSNASVVGSQGSFTDNIAGSPYKLLSSEGDQNVLNEVHNPPSEIDQVLAKNQRNSSSFEKGYGLLPGKCECDDIQKIPESLQNGFHDNSNFSISESENLILKNNDDYHLLGYKNDGFISGELDVVENKTKEEPTDNSDDVSVKELKIESDNTDLEVTSADSEKVKNLKDTEERNGNSTETANSNTIVTEAHVHTISYDKNESKMQNEMDNRPVPIETSTLKSTTNSLYSDDEHEVIEKTMDISSDWPDLDELIKPIASEDIIIDACVEEPVIYVTEVVTEIPNDPGDVSENSKSVNINVDNVHNENNSTEDSDENTIVQNEAATVNNEKATVHDKQVVFSESEQTHEKVRTNSTGGDFKAGTSSTRTLKSILSNNGSEPQSLSGSVNGQHNRSISQDEIQECKSVKFSEDTVFHENRPRKYRIEKIDRIHLRDIYRGKISSSAAAKLNPLYKDDGEEQGEPGSMTDDEKVAYQEAIRKMMNSNHQPGSLNAPSYMEHYLIMKAHGLKSTSFDIEQLPSEMERPAYDRLIQRTLAKERRKLIIKWTLVVLTVGIITVVATILGVYLRGR